MDYYHISAQELGKDAKLPILKLGDSGEVFLRDGRRDVRCHPRQQRRRKAHRLYLPGGTGGAVPHLRAVGQPGGGSP